MRVSTHALLLTLALLTTACGGPLRYGIVTNSLQPPYYAMAGIAMQDLENRVGERYLHGNTDDARWVQISIATVDLGTDYLGQAVRSPEYNYTCQVTLNTNTYGLTIQQDFENVLAHELGHCFGLEHLTESPNVMYPYYVMGTVFTVTAWGTYTFDLATVRNTF